MKSYTITIPFTPKAKGAVRLGKHGWYNPSYKGMNRVKDFVKAYMMDKGMSLLDGPLFVITHYRIPLPVNLSKKRKQEKHLCPHIARPDGDNYEKFLNDSLNGVLWADDSLISWLLRSKSLTEEKEGSVTIFVAQIDETKPNYEALSDMIQKHIDLDLQAQM